MVINVLTILWQINTFWKYMCLQLHKNIILLYNIAHGSRTGSANQVVVVWKYFLQEQMDIILRENLLLKNIEI